MATQTQTIASKAQEIRELFADAPELAKSALKNALPSLVGQLAETEGARTESAGRIGIRQGTVSELTVIAPFAPGGAKRLRAIGNAEEPNWPHSSAPRVVSASSTHTGMSRLSRVRNRRVRESH